MKNKIRIVVIFALSFLVFFVIAILLDKLFNFKCYQPLIFSSFMVSLLFVIKENKNGK